VGDGAAGYTDSGVLSTGELLVYYEGPFDYHAGKGDMSLVKIRPKIPATTNKTAWTFLDSSIGWQGWTLSPSVKERSLSGQIQGFVGGDGPSNSGPAVDGAVVWIQSPPIWVRITNSIFGEIDSILLARDINIF
jgi:hypothetical protein